MACITVFPILFFTYVHYLFRGQRDAKRIVIFATAPSWKEGLWQWFIAFTAFLGVLIFMLALLLLFLGIIFLVSALMNQSVGEDPGGAFTVGFFRGLERSLENALPERLIALPAILWLLIASEMMAWKRRTAQPQKLKTTQKAEFNPTSQPITIDDELDRLKTQIEADKKNNP